MSATFLIWIPIISLLAERNYFELNCFLCLLTNVIINRWVYEISYQVRKLGVKTDLKSFVHDALIE